MPFVRSVEAVTHDIHGVGFVAYANSATGAKEVCAWRGEVPAGTPGVAHTVNREEIIHVMTGSLRFHIDGEVADLSAGDVAIVPAGAEVRLDNLSDASASVWTATTVGLRATLADGSTLNPPWAN